VDEVEEIEVFLHDILQGKVPHQSRGSFQGIMGIWGRLKSLWPWSLALPVSLLVLIASLFWSVEDNKAPEEKAASEDEDARQEVPVGSGDEQDEGEDAAPGDTSQQKSANLKKNE
jgi:hypothetical protein